MNTVTFISLDKLCIHNKNTIYEWTETLHSKTQACLWKGGGCTIDIYVIKISPKLAPPLIFLLQIIDCIEEKMHRISGEEIKCLRYKVFKL